MTETSTAESQKLKVFVSYSRTDVAFADQLVAALGAFGFEPIIDRHQISGGEDWKARLGALLLDADSVVFVLSPDISGSPIFAWEVEETDRLAKRKFPIVCRSIGQSPVPPPLKNLNYIMFYPEEKVPGSGFGSGIAQLVAALKTDLDWIREHTRLGGLAAYWDRRGRDDALLIRGSELKDAEQWLARQPSGAPDAGEITRAFLAESRHNEDAAQNKKLRDARRVAQVTTFGLIVSLILAGVAVSQWWNARIQRDKAQATSEDAAEVARIAREQLSDANDELVRSHGDLLDWAPPRMKGYLYTKRASAYTEQGDLARGRTDLDRAIRADPNLARLRNSSADGYVVAGDPERALEDAKRAIENRRTDAVVFGNLILAEAQLRDYASALAHIDEALQNSQRVIYSIETIVSADTQAVTRGFKLQVRDSDYLFALRYLKAIIYAMMGDEKFEPALLDADKLDRDYPFSRTAYVTALNWQWLILRGQALQDARDENNPGAEKKEGDAFNLPIRDYGAYAAVGALWTRVATTRPEFLERAKIAFAKFDELYAKAPSAHYAKLAQWVEQQSQLGIKRAAGGSRDLAAARDNLVKAIELSRGPNSDNDPYSVAPAIALLSESIKTLEAKRVDHTLGRREEDILISLLLRRAEWRLKPKNEVDKDYGGASQDARRVLEIDEKIAPAYVLIAKAARDEKLKREAFERAFALDPSDTDALSGLVDLTVQRGRQKAQALLRQERYLRRIHVSYKHLAELMEIKDAKKALGLLERLSTLKRFWSTDFATLANLQSKLGQNSAAAQTIEKSIGLAPWNSTYYVRRREYELKAGKDQVSADINLVRGYHTTAGYYARTGNDSEALKSFVTALRQASKLPSDERNAKLELESVTKDFSTFLSERFGRDVSSQWWHSLAENPFVSDREKQLAIAEGERVAAEK